MMVNSPLTLSSLVQALHVGNQMVSGTTLQTNMVAMAATRTVIV